MIKPITKRKYDTIPKYPLPTMDKNLTLQEYANAIESALCAFDASLGKKMNDDAALKILELLLDKYYFMDNDITSEDKLILDGFNFVNNVIENDLSDIEKETIVKIIKTIHFVAKRRSEGHREYLDFIHKYVGIRVGKGARALPESILRD